MGKIMAYIRVSTDKQDVENQRLEILSLANENGFSNVQFVGETVSGRTSWRDREIFNIVNELTMDDVIIVSELSRLGRSMLEIMEILSVATQKKIKIYASKGNWSLDGTIQSKLSAMCFSMASEIERDLISQRTKAALATLKSKGIKLGRKPGPGKSKLDKHKEKILEYLKLGVTKKRIAELVDTTPANLRHWMKQRRIP